MDLFGAVEPTDGMAYRRLGFDDHQRQAVNQKHQVGTPLRGPGPKSVLRRDDELVAVEIVIVNQLDGDMFVVDSKRHRALAAQPGGEFFVGADESIGAHRKHDGAQFVENFVGAFGLGGDLWVEADEGFAQVGFNEHVVDAARQVKRGDIMPARAFVIASKRDVERGVFVTLPTRYGRRRYACKHVDDVVFDGVLFIEHGYIL